jgi:hypothetical protein
MESYSRAAVERAMKVQEVILQAMARKITWYQAAAIIGISDRLMRRWRERYEEFRYDGLFNRRPGKPSPKRVPMRTLLQAMGLAVVFPSTGWILGRAGYVGPCCRG